MTPHNFPTLPNLGPWIEETLASPKPQWLIENIIPAAGLTFIAGRPKRAKKSWLAQAMSMMVAQGKGAAGLHVPEAKRVLFFSREGAAPPIAQRFLLLEKGLGLNIAELSPNFFHAMNGAVFLDEPAHVGHILRMVDTMKIDLVVFDTWARSQRGDENSVKDVSVALRGVERIRDAGAATILVHHSRKSGNGQVGSEPDADAGLRGSSALQGAYDSIVSLQELEVEGITDLWAIVGGKYVDYCAYRVGWDITPGGGAKLTMDGPQDLPSLEVPKNEPRF